MENRKKEKKQLLRAEGRAAYICLIPSIIGLIFLTYGPLLAVLILSFFDWKGVGTPNWVGLANYVRLFTKDPYFKDSMAIDRKIYNGVFQFCFGQYAHLLQNAKMGKYVLHLQYIDLHLYLAEQ